MEMAEFYLAKLTDGIMIFGPNIGFIAQILKFREAKSSGGFSKFVSLILLIANILRIFFWIGKRFSAVLLYQSILSIIMQIIVLRECLRLAPINTYSVKKSGYAYTADEHSDLHIKPVKFADLKNFWNWPFLIDYIYTLTVFTISLGFISNIIGYQTVQYIETIGVISASVEACIGLPQVISNYKSRSTDTLSVFMIITWMFGDTFKTVYFLKTAAPLQLVICGLVQLTIDLILISQIVYYTKFSKNPTTKGKNDSIPDIDVTIC